MKLTVRARLTLVYGGVFVLAGLVLLGLTYVFVTNELPTTVSQTAERSRGVGNPAGEPVSEVTIERVVASTRVNVQHAVLVESGIALLAVSAVAIGLGWLIAGRMLRP